MLTFPAGARPLWPRAAGDPIVSSEHFYHLLFMEKFHPRALERGLILFCYSSVQYSISSQSIDYNKRRSTHEKLNLICYTTEAIINILYGRIG